MDTTLQGAFRSAGKRRMPDYREKLAAAAPYQNEAPAVYASDGPAAHIRRLADEADTGSLAFQSVLVAALKVLGRLYRSEHQVEGAAISLAQREKLQSMVISLEQTIDVLKELLSSQGHNMLRLDPNNTAQDAEESSWTQSVEQANRVCAESTDWMRYVVAGQPREGAARQLSDIVTDLLRSHNEELHGEVEKLKS